MHRRNGSLFLIAAMIILLAGCSIQPVATLESPPSEPPTAAPEPHATLPVSSEPAPSSIQPGSYDFGSPVLTDLWVDPLNGSDIHTGASRNQALRTINAAWERIPQGTPLVDTGYRIMLAAGDYPDTDFPVYWESRLGTFDHPVVIQSADGPGKARLSGFVNVFGSSYLYLLDISIATDGDVFHCEQCDHLLIRGVTMDGGSGHNAHETIKINQSQHVYIENSDIFNSYENAIDMVATQYGHVLHNKLHDGDDWCIYLKGGSAYFRIEGNEIYNCGTGGFSAGQGSGLEYLVSPWLHYEAYDIKFVNNIVHDTQGAGVGVNGGYDILIAWNTLYRVGANSHVIEVVFGSRSCDGDVQRCAANLALGGWGTQVTGMDGEPIPDRNIYIYNNLIYNPAGYQSQWQQFAIFGPRAPSAGSHIPSPSTTDFNLQIRGNLIWNGGRDMPLGIEDPSMGCQPSNPTCNAAQLLAENAINTIEPKLVDPDGGDFHLSSGVDLSTVMTYPIPDFTWDDAPRTPSVPAGNLSNLVSVDLDSIARQAGNPPGGFSSIQ